jgi:trigger factor
LILNEIANKEDIQISEEEIEEELKNVAKANNVPLAQVIETVNKEGRKDNLKENLLMRKTVDFLVDKAII